MGSLGSSMSSSLSPEAMGKLHSHECRAVSQPPPLASAHPPSVAMGHVAEDGEDGEPRDEAGDTVDGAGEQGIPGGRHTVSSSRLALPNLLMDGCAVYEVSAAMPSPIQFSCARDPSAPPSPGKSLQVQEISNSFWMKHSETTVWY